LGERSTDYRLTVTMLVVQAHPLDDSYNAALLDAVVAGLDHARVARLGQGDQLDAADLDQITSLTVVYPTWWGSVPAQLLAALNDLVGPWVDGKEPPLLSPHGGCANRRSAKLIKRATRGAANRSAHLPASPLSAVRTLTIVTTHGSSKFINRLQGEPGLQLWKRTILPLCAPEAEFNWQALYRVDRATPTVTRKFLRRVMVAGRP